MGKGAKAVKRVPSSALPTIQSSRVPRKLMGVSLNAEAAEHHPLWRLQLLDCEYDGDWSWRKIDSDALERIVTFLAEMERLAWREIWAQRFHSKNRDSPKHKFIPATSIVKPAQDRLVELGLEDQDELFRFRLANMNRLWGVLLNEGPTRVFYPIWWDPDHAICP